MIPSGVLLVMFAGGPGEALFFGSAGCSECHTVGGRGGVVGPDLSDIGVYRTLDELRRSLQDPGAEIAPAFRTLTAVTREGARVAGIRVNEDDISIQLRSRGGGLHSFQKDSLRSLERDGASLMPPARPADIAPLAGYLAGLRAPLPTMPRRRPIAPTSERSDWLTRAGRDAEEMPDRVLDALEIPRDAVVTDIGAGTGYFTFRLAARAAQVIAVDLNDAMLGAIRAEAGRRGMANIETRRGLPASPGMAPASTDLVLLANAYHEFAEPEAMMAAIARALRPGGRLAMIEYRGEDVYAPMPELHKMTLREMRSEMESMGFETLRVLDFLPRQHLAIFRVKEAK